MGKMKEYFYDQLEKETKKPDVSEGVYLIVETLVLAWFFNLALAGLVILIFGEF